MEKDRILNNLLQLCSVPSVSETNGELDMAKKIYEILKEIDYFVTHPDMLQLCPMDEDPYQRSFVYALMKSEKKTSKTIILLSHFDVVDVEDYGIYKDYAFDPKAYTQILKENPQIQISKEAKEDLDSGDYLFGRGIMDMKFGIAADLEVLFQMNQELATFQGNILFLSVPDEEANSSGMLEAVKLLLSIKEAQQLEYTCCLVSEPHFPKYPGDDTKYIYTGTVGKLLPAFYCVGKETHVCEPFSGLNPNHFTAAIINHIDSNPALSDFILDTTVPPPVCLKASDGKTTYSVQTPTAAYTYFNYMTLTQTPQDVLQKMKQIAEASFEMVLFDLQKKAEDFSKKTGKLPELLAIQPKVLTFQELYDLCYEIHKDNLKSHLEKFIKNRKEHQDLRDFSIEIVKEVYQFCPYRDPIIILFYAPPFYPHSDMQLSNGHVMEVCQHLIKFAKKAFDEELQIEPFFPGLSDMSYLGLSKSVDIIGLTKNFPLWGLGYHVPLDIIAKLNIPFINIGPLGKDAHKYTERLCLSYSIEKATTFIWEAVISLLKLA